MTESVLKRLEKWFLKNKRSFPWRKDITPYKVWVSEVMLQQTQAGVAAPYFLRWMERFPTIESLAESAPEEVIKMWEGLGYYSRARNLHQGAKDIMRLYEGKLPDAPEKLSRIKGLGPYTVSAILSFAFHKRDLALDSNVLRVLARFFAVEQEISKSSTKKILKALGMQLLPKESPWIISEALIELGAVICKKKPICSMCPLQSGCASFAKNIMDKLPNKALNKPTIPLMRAVAIIICEGKILIKKGGMGAIMAGLHEFPYFPQEAADADIDALQKTIQEDFLLKVKFVKRLDREKHSFTHYRVQLDPLLFLAPRSSEVPGFSWMSVEELKLVAFSSGHRRIFEKLRWLIS